MKRTRTITLVSFAATVLASCDNPPTVQECMAAAAGGGIPATCEQVLERNEAAFLTGGGIQPDADQCIAFARNESYPASCERFVNRSTGLVTGSGGSHSWVFVNPVGTSSSGTALRSRGWARPVISVSSRLTSSTAVPRAVSPAPASKSFSIFSSSRGGFSSGGGSSGG